MLFQSIIGATQKRWGLDVVVFKGILGFFGIGLLLLFCFVLLYFAVFWLCWCYSVATQKNVARLWLRLLRLRLKRVCVDDFDGATKF